MWSKMCYGCALPILPKKHDSQSDYLTNTPSPRLLCLPLKCCQLSLSSLWAAEKIKIRKGKDLTI